MDTPLKSILPWVDLPPDEQRAKKRSFVQTALSNRGLNCEVAPVVASPLQRGYRARVKLRSGPGGALGFHQPQSHEFVEVPLEDVAIAPVVELAKELKARGFLKEEAELRSDGKKAVLVLSQVLPKAFRDLPAVAVNNKHAVGDCFLWIDGLRVSPLSFYQVNLEVNRLIREDVDRWLIDLAPARLLDLFAGMGNLSAKAIARGTPCTLLEKEGSACSDARFNFRGKPHVEIIEGNAGKFTSGQTFFDVALLDPPRAGAPGLLPRLALTRPRAILYLSCDPVSLAKDLGEIRGYDVAAVTPYDMFPGTDHVETLVVLLRK